MDSGGKSSTDEDGNRKLMSSQLATSAGIRDLLNNLSGKWPMIIIMGKNGALFGQSVAYFVTRKSMCHIT